MILVFAAILFEKRRNYKKCNSTTIIREDEMFDYICIVLFSLAAGKIGLGIVIALIVLVGIGFIVGATMKTFYPSVKTFVETVVKADVTFTNKKEE